MASDRRRHFDCPASFPVPFWSTPGSMQQPASHRRHAAARNYCLPRSVKLTLEYMVPWYGWKKDQSHGRIHPMSDDDWI